jgi:hypothetical protein
MIVTINSHSQHFTLPIGKKNRNVSPKVRPFHFKATCTQYRPRLASRLIAARFAVCLCLRCQVVFMALHYFVSCSSFQGMSSGRPFIFPIYLQSQSVFIFVSAVLGKSYNKLTMLFCSKALIIFQASVRGCLH